VNFLNIGPLELTVILIIAILTIGPKRMVEVTRAISRAVAQLRRYSSEFASSLQAEVMAAEREEGEPPQDIVKSLTEPIESVQAELQAAARETRRAVENIIEGQTEPIESVQAELQAVARETRQTLADKNAIEDDSSEES
jgi:Sec-independent protein translocase protein TatA